jgi:hypothetical protein
VKNRKQNNKRFHLNQSKVEVCQARLVSKVPTYNKEMWIFEVCIFPELLPRSRAPSYAPGVANLNSESARDFAVADKVTLIPDSTAER